MSDLDPTQRFMLRHLALEGLGQYGEYRGKTLDLLIERGLVQVHGPGEHQQFIAKDFAGTKGIDYRAISLTDAGIEAVRALGVEPA